MRSLLLTVTVAAASSLAFGGASAIEEVYNKEHFFDIYHKSDGSGTPGRNGVIALFEPSCRDKLWSLGYNEMGNPLRLLTMIHDWKTSREVTWYKWTDAFDLTTVFDVSQCPSIYYLPRKPGNQFEKWDNQGS